MHCRSRIICIWHEQYYDKIKSLSLIYFMCVDKQFCSNDIFPMQVLITGKNS